MLPCDHRWGRAPGIPQNQGGDGGVLSTAAAFPELWTPIGQQDPRLHAAFPPLHSPLWLRVWVSVCVSVWACVLYSVCEMGALLFTVGWTTCLHFLQPQRRTWIPGLPRKKVCFMLKRTPLQHHTPLFLSLSSLQVKSTCLQILDLLKNHFFQILVCLAGFLLFKIPCCYQLLQVDIFLVGFLETPDKSTYIYRSSTVLFLSEEQKAVICRGWF